MECKKRVNYIKELEHKENYIQELQKKIKELEIGESQQKILGNSDRLIHFSKSSQVIDVKS